MQEFTTTVATIFVGGTFGGSAGAIMGIIVGLSVDYFNFNTRRTQQNHKSMMINKIHSLEFQLYQAKINKISQQQRINDLEQVLTIKTNKLLEDEFIFDEDLTAPESSPIPGQYSFIKTTTT
mmetsp:Transcript_53788/g.48391  ORF Transcript_53788/g.48391 Transcript_53788/m.48391 type:complete len:122 (-) Transcript_53788:369-734(-)